MKYTFIIKMDFVYLNQRYLYIEASSSFPTTQSNNN